MRAGVVIALLVLVAGAACERTPKKTAATAGSGSGSSSGSGSGSGASAETDEFLPAPAFTIEEVDLPDEPAWHRAATVAARGWAESFNKAGVTTAKVTVVRSSDGSVVPYLLQVEAIKGTARIFTGKALISDGRNINGGGKGRLSKHLASIGFPARQLPADLLLDMVRLTGAIERAWFTATPAVAYDDRGAALALTRGGERLEVRFAPDATLTTTP